MGGVVTILKFDRDFAPDPYALAADAPSGRRVRFLIDHSILHDVFGSWLPLRDNANLALCRAERVRIVAACTRAFANRPAVRIELRQIDFR
jgi:hypothetical protein